VFRISIWVGLELCLGG